MPKDIGGLSGPSLSFNKHSRMWQREYQVGTTSLRPWQVLHGDNKRKHYWWLTRQSADRSSTTPHLFGVQTYMPPTTEKSKTHRTRLWESLLDVTRCLVLIIYTQKQKWWKLKNTQSYCLHSTWPDAWNQEMYVIPSQQGLPLKDRWRRRYTPDIETL